MTPLEPGLYLRIEALENSPKPHFFLRNDREEIYFICNRHVPTHSLRPIKDATRHQMAPV